MNPSMTSAVNGEYDCASNSSRKLILPQVETFDVSQFVPLINKKYEIRANTYLNVHTYIQKEAWHMFVIDSDLFTCIKAAIKAAKLGRKGFYFQMFSFINFNLFSFWHSTSLD